MLDVAQLVSQVETNGSWQQFVTLCQSIYYSTPFRLAAVLVLVAATIWAIAKVYSGELQNADKGPLAVRRHKGTVGTVPLDTLVVPRELISLTMDGVHARCTFMYVYEGHRNKLIHVPLLSKWMRLSVTASKIPVVQSMARANEIPDVGSEEVYWPILDVEIDDPSGGERTAERAIDYAEQNRVLDRWSGDDNLCVVSVHDEVLDEVVTARSAFIDGRVKRLRDSKAGDWLTKLRFQNAGRDRPGAVGNYYVRFQFSNDPGFVLLRHPDRDVRMTAWLTVLTSAFAILVELFPLQPTPPPGVIPFLSSPSAEQPARQGPRPRVVRP